MFIKPQIMSTPHLIAPMGEAAGAACTQGGFTQCQSGWSGSCQPWGGQGCIDTSYVDPVAIGGVIIIGAVIGGGVVIIAK